MNNYEYIIASLPVLSQDPQASTPDADRIILEIKSQLSPRDNKALDTLLTGFNPDMLDRDFYLTASRSGSGFIREYFRYDLNIRNAKVEFLNKALGRSEGQDMIDLGSSLEEFEDIDAVRDALDSSDILGRERSLDNLMWNKVSDMTLFHVFDLDLILAFVVRLKIVDRWNRLDPVTGREMFRRLVEEIRKNR